MLARGISPDAIKMVRKELEDWIDHFHHPADNVEEVVCKIRTNPLIPKDVPVHGLCVVSAPLQPCPTIRWRRRDQARY